MAEPMNEGVESKVVVITETTFGPKIEFELVP
jgi:hypothetical protein